MLLIQRLKNYRRKMRLDSNAVSESTPVYEDILPPERRNEIELQENVSYGPASILAPECQ